MTLDEALRVAIEVLREPENNYPDDPGDGESFPLGQGNAAALVLDRLRGELLHVAGKVELARKELGVICLDPRRFTMCVPVRDTDSDIVIANALDAIARLNPLSEERT